MSSTRTARILKVVAGVLGALLLGYACLVALVMWEYRDHIYTIPNSPNAFTDDASILRLSAAALHLHGADPAGYTPGSYWGGVTVGRNELDPNRVNTHWIPRSPGVPGYGIDLEQHGSDVVCHVGLAK